MSNISLNSTENNINGSYRLERAVIAPYGSANGIDISTLLMSFVLSESIDSDAYRGSITIGDATGLLSGNPFHLRGEESLTLEFYDAFGDGFTLEAFVWMISDVQQSSNQSFVTYTLHFVSKERLAASVKRVVKAFEGTASDIAKNVFSLTYGKNGKITAENSEGMLKVIIPNYNGPQAMAFLTSRANGSSQSPASSFRFFERLGKGFFFVSDEWLINESQKSKRVFNLYQASALRKDGTDIMIQRGNIKSISHSEHANTLGDHQSGAYRNRTLEIDMYRRTINEHIFDRSVNGVGSFVKTDARQLEKHTKEFEKNILCVDGNERSILFFKDSSSIGDLPGTIKPEENIGKFVGPRIAYRAAMNGTRISVNLDGRFDMHVGDMVNLDIPDFGTFTKRESNKKLSGKYLIAAVNHAGAGDRFGTTLGLMKFEWGSISDA